jgi:hypothetical protein
MCELAMGKASCTIKQTEITRVLKAAKKAGVDMQLQIDLERKTMTVTTVKVIEPVERHPKSDMTGDGEWDNIQ